MEQLQIFPVRKCPYCLKLRPETGGAFCGTYCEFMWRKEKSANTN